MLNSHCNKNDKKQQLENVFVKHYAPIHMPDTKKEWSLKENNSELGLTYLFRFFTTCITYYNMHFFRIRTKAYCLFSSSPRELHYGIRSNVNQFIYTWVCNHMPDIRILA